MASVVPMSFFTPDETINPNEYTFEITDAAARGDFATIETSTTASKAYAVGDFLLLNGVLYKVTAAIAQGGAIASGTNVVATTIGDEVAEKVRKILGDFATIENTFVASKAYASGDMFIYDGYLYRALVDINAGASFVEGTNVVKDTVNEYVKGLVNPYKPVVDCDDPQTYYTTYNKDSLHSPYTTGATTAVAGILITLRKTPSAWNKQIAISDSNGELFKRYTEGSTTWSDWTRLIPKFAYKAFNINYTVAGNSSVHLTSNIGMTGYVPAAITTFTSNNGVVLTQHLTINGSTNVLDVWIRSIGSSSVTATYTVTLLYISSGFGI